MGDATLKEMLQVTSKDSRTAKGGTLYLVRCKCIENVLNVTPRGQEASVQIQIPVDKALWDQMVEGQPFMVEFTMIKPQA